MQIPPVNTDLKATGPVLIYQEPGSDKRWNYSHNEFSLGIVSGNLQPVPPGSDRDYQAEDSLGHSLGIPVTGTDGLSYVKIECFQWRYRKVAIFFNESYREYHIGYLLLSDRDVTWAALTPDGATTADKLTNLVAVFEAEYLAGYRANGISQPAYSLVVNAKGEPRLYLTFLNGYYVDAILFTGLTLPERLALTGVKSDSSTDAPPPANTFNVWAIIAGAGILALMGVVILIQIQRRRRKNTQHGNA